MATPTKRTRDCDSGSAKRVRGGFDVKDVARLCDLRGADETFASKHNSSKAREKGILRSRDASAKYEELERKLFMLLKDSGELDFPSEDWVFEVIPELGDLEPDTLDTLLNQAQQHAKYEAAARELVLIERYKLEEAHEAEMRKFKAVAESDATRQSVNGEMKLKAHDEHAREQLDALQEEANERIEELEKQVEELEGTIEEQNEKMRQLEEDASEECEKLRRLGQDAVRQFREAQEETDLKREASRKLKEEIIDNDRLTVANLNRIKHLEAVVEQHKAALEEAEAENAELRTELAGSVDVKEAEEQQENLRELLQEREGQLLAMSRRLSDALEKNQREAEEEAYERAVGHSSPPLSMRAGAALSAARGRESFLDRFGLKGISSGA